MLTLSSVQALRPTSLCLSYLSYMRDIARSSIIQYTFIAHLVQQQNICNFRNIAGDAIEVYKYTDRIIKNTTTTLLNLISNVEQD